MHSGAVDKHYLESVGWAYHGYNSASHECLSSWSRLESKDKGKHNTAEVSHATNDTSLKEGQRYTPAPNFVGERDLP
jgi:hypothetical protein